MVVFKSHTFIQERNRGRNWVGCQNIFSGKSYSKKEFLGSLSYLHQDLASPDKTAMHCVPFFGEKDYSDGQFQITQRHHFKRM